MYPDHMYYYGWSHAAGWGGWAMLFGMILFFALASLAVILLVRYFVALSHSPDTSQQFLQKQQKQEQDTAIDILNRRYARGEISKDEYDRIKKDIAA